MEAGVITGVIESPKKDKNGKTYWIAVAIGDGAVKRTSNFFIEGEFKVNDAITIAPRGEYFEFLNVNTLTKEVVAKVKETRTMLQEMWA